MVTVAQLAEKFEDELNALLDYENLSFKIWVDAGERQRPERVGNNVQTYINGEIVTTSSTIAPNKLLLGTNYFTIVFDVPVDPPKTTAKQTAEDLQRVINGQYWFVLQIFETLSAYFQQYRSIVLKDAEETEFSLGIVSAAAIPQGIDLTAWRGNTVPVNVYVEANVAQGGIVSLDVAVQLDGADVPFQSFTPERAGALDPAVYSGDDLSRVISTSTAFAAEISVPSNTVYGSSQAAVEYLLQGPPNMVHFLSVQWGGEQAPSGLYLVTITQASGGVQGVQIASTTFRLAEVQPDIELIDVPDGFKVGYFELGSSDVTSISVTAGADCLAYIAGAARRLTANTAEEVSLSPKDIIYDDESEEYRVYMILSADVSVTAPGYSFEVL